MTAPPGIAPNTEPGRGTNRSEGDTALSLRKAKWRLVDELGCTPIVADRFVRAWALDRHDAAKAAEWAERLDHMTTADLRRLMEETPLRLGRRRPVARHGRDYRPRDDEGRLITGGTR